MKISHSAVSTLLTCGKKYENHYIKRKRAKTISGALLFGGAIDHGLNTLVATKDLLEATKAFDKSFRYNFINGTGHSIPDSTLVVYAAKDFDEDLLYPEDMEKLNSICSDGDPLGLYYSILGEKESQGFTNLTDPNKRYYNLVNWLSMRRKGHVMLKSYSEEVLPKIKEVLATQKRVGLKNDQGDEFTGFLDLAVEFEDGKRYILDNKTSAKEYEADSAMRSQQLIGYYHAEKDELKLDGVGYVVMYKQIQKNRKKICSVCSFDGSGKTHKTCNNEVEGKRCGSSWNETVDPKCRIDIILNTVSPAAEALVMDTYDEANERIKNGNFAPNLDSCMKYGMPCPYYRSCWFGDESDLVTLEKKKNE